jgi:aerobic carbon-monoxide dehydrogenase large subunit
MSIIGTRVVRNEDPQFLTTGATYTEDLVDERLTGALHLTFVRSPFAHARILGIDTSEALVAPGVVGVYTHADLGLGPQHPMPMLEQRMAQPPLADGTVRFVGEQVAAVVTEQKYQGEDAAALVMVDYEPLDAVTDPEAALAGDVLLYPDIGSNVAAAFDWDKAPDDDLFAGCEVVVSQRVVNQRVATASMEGRAGAATLDGDGRIVAWVSNQAAQAMQRGLAGALGIEPAGIRVITPDVGGGFGAKVNADPEYVVLCRLAQLLKRPLRWTETRWENLLGMTHGRGQVQTVTIGGSRDGKVAAYRLDIVQDCGAYPKLGGFLPFLTRMMAPGVYDIPKVVSRAVSVVTNATPTSAYRGAGRPEATAAVERAMDLFAAEAGLDPAEVRRVNLLPKFTEPRMTVSGAPYDSGDYEGALDRALAASGYAGLRAEQARRREAGDVHQLGIGVCVYVEITGPSLEGGAPSENATVEIHPDGTATILTGTSPHGQGHATAWAMLASEEFGIPVDKITVRHGDTDLVPRGGGTMGSRSLQQGGAAVTQASRELVDLARERAADLLEAAPADVVVDTDRQGVGVAGAPGSFISFADLAGRDRLFVHSVFSAAGPTFPFGAHVAVVDVDTESGRVTLQRLVAVDDAGTVLNPLLAEGQRHGGLAQGASQALLEEVVYDDDGNPQTSTFATYPFPSITELPSFELVDMATPTSYNPLGAKGIGESGTVGATPAVQSAVVDAVAHLGVRHIDIPTTPQRVWEAIRSARGAGA